jgi:pyruvate kinase
MDINKLQNELSQILLEIIDSEPFIDEKVNEVHPDYKSSAKNLLRYLILRSKDLRSYHGALSDLGVSSLRSAEGYVFSNVYNVVRNLHLIQNNPFVIDTDVEIIGYTRSQELIREHASNLFNDIKKDHFTEIMVTLPEEAADDQDLIYKMAQSGMEIARINLSHGHLGIWEKMVSNIRAGEKETGQRIKIYMDLSGPKIRTSEIKIRSKKGKIKNSIHVRVGEHILLAKEPEAFQVSESSNKRKNNKKTIQVLLEEVIDDSRIGETVLFDDGMIKSVVIDKNENSLKLKITECYKPKIGSHKGINLPQTRLNLPALTEKDMSDLPFACQNADIIGYSFVRSENDVQKLYTELEKYNAAHLGVVFKIENQEAFENLPEILLKGMKQNKIGVMIARGDLAVEIGFERISEVQNEILWICEAAHVPVIWATQVLENLAKTGIPTRAEISDAALSAQAECVMLNKGKSIITAIKVLKNILIRMEGHSFKKKNELRALKVAQSFMLKLKNE